MGTETGNENRYYVEVTDAAVSDPHASFSLNFTTNNGASLPSPINPVRLRIFFDANIMPSNGTHEQQRYQTVITDPITTNPVFLSIPFTDPVYSRDGNATVWLSVGIHSKDSSGNYNKPVTMSVTLSGVNNGNPVIFTPPQGNSHHTVRVTNPGDTISHRPAGGSEVSVTTETS